MANVKFVKCTEVGSSPTLPVGEGFVEEGTLYHCVDTGNVYLGEDQGGLIPVNRPVYYARCTTGSSTVAKVAILSNTEAFTLVDGVMIVVEFANKNTATNPTLTLKYGMNDTVIPAKPIYRRYTSSAQTSAGSAQQTSWHNGDSVVFVYNSTANAWVMCGKDIRPRPNWEQDDSTSDDFILNKPFLTLNKSYTPSSVTAGWYTLCTFKQGGNYVLYTSGVYSAKRPTVAALSININYIYASLKLLSCDSSASITKFRLVGTGASPYKWRLDYYHVASSSSPSTRRFMAIGVGEGYELLQSSMTAAAEPTNDETVVEISTREMLDRPTIRTNLGSESSSSMNGGNITPGVQGTLPIAHGGTGATLADEACDNLGAAKMSEITVELDKLTEIASLPTRYGYIDYSTGKWSIPANPTASSGVHVLMPVNESYVRLKVTANSTYGFRIAFFTDDSYGVNGSLPTNYVSGTSLIYSQKDERWEGTIPEGTKFLYVYRGNPSAATPYPYSPSELKVYSVRGNADEATMSSWNGYGSCSTDPESNPSSPMVVTMSGYELHTGGIAVVKFTHDVRDNATMNINGQGSKPIYKDGSAITSGMIRAGSTATFIYDGTSYNLISVSNAQLVDNLVTAVSSASTNSQYPSALCLYNIVGNIETLLADI